MEEHWKAIGHAVGLQGGELNGELGDLKLQSDKLRAYVEVSLGLLTKDGLLGDFQTVDVLREG